MRRYPIRVRIGLKAQRALTEVLFTSKAPTSVSRIRIHALIRYMLRGEDCLLEFRKGDSQLWKFICDQREVIESGSKWTVRDGKLVIFFSDRWFFKDRRMSDMTLRSLSEEEMQSKVANWVEAGAWNFTKLADIILAEVFHRLITVLPPRPDSGLDFLSWNATTNGVFSMKSAYAVIEDLKDCNNNSIYKLIWKWRGAERVREFLWISYNNRLPTNLWRSKWSSTSSLCACCNAVDEDILHILRDCEYAKTNVAEVN